MVGLQLRAEQDINGVIFKLSRFGRFKQSCRCMKLEKPGTAQTRIYESVSSGLLGLDELLTMALKYLIELPLYALLASS